MDSVEVVKLRHKGIQTSSFNVSIKEFSGGVITVTSLSLLVPLPVVGFLVSLSVIDGKCIPKSQIVSSFPLMFHRVNEFTVPKYTLYFTKVCNFYLFFVILTLGLFFELIQKESLLFYVSFGDEGFNGRRTD